MAAYLVRFRIAPPAPFGLPDSEKTVVPVGTTDVVGPPMDTRSGAIVGHGTLSVFRTEQQRLELREVAAATTLQLYDDYLELTLDAASADAAYEGATRIVDLFCQSLSAQAGFRFWAEFLFVEDSNGVPQRIRRPQSIRIMNLTVYNIDELRERCSRAFVWAHAADDRAKKALLYFEHACLMQEYAGTHDAFSRHAAFSRALAFLQLFKGVTTILGDPSTDRDYQRRFRELGLPSNFWKTRVEPLYKIRNDEDVAHHSLEPPDPSHFLTEFGAAAAVFREALAAYFDHKANSTLASSR